MPSLCKATQRLQRHRLLWCVQSQKIKKPKHLCVVFSFFIMADTSQRGRWVCVPAPVRVCVCVWAKGNRGCFLLSADSDVGTTSTVPSPPPHQAFSLRLMSVSVFSLSFSNLITLLWTLSCEGLYFCSLSRRARRHSEGTVGGCGVRGGGWRDASPFHFVPCLRFFFLIEASNDFCVKTQTTTVWLGSGQFHHYLMYYWNMTTMTTPNFTVTVSSNADKLKPEIWG